MTKGLQYMNEIKDSVVAMFNTICNKGILGEEPLRGVRFNLIDANLHQDTVHRNAAQIMPAARKALYASLLTASPKLIEPYFSIQIQVPDNQIGKIYSTINHRRGKITDEERINNTPLVLIKGFLPVLESFKIDSHLKSITSGSAFIQLNFSHWESMEENPIDTSSKSGKLVIQIRKRKNLRNQVPELNEYLDKL